jgi:hypothetical protein
LDLLAVGGPYRRDLGGCPTIQIRDLLYMRLPCGCQLPLDLHLTLPVPEHCEPGTQPQSQRVDQDPELRAPITSGGAHCAGFPRCDAAAIV